MRKTLSPTEGQAMLDSLRRPVVPIEEDSVVVLFALVEIKSDRAGILYGLYPTRSAARYVAGLTSTPDGVRVRRATLKLFNS